MASAMRFSVVLAVLFLGMKKSSDQSWWAKGFDLLSILFNNLSTYGSPFANISILWPLPPTFPL